jgi:hypothetical protein
MNDLDTFSMLLAYAISAAIAVVWIFVIIAIEFSSALDDAPEETCMPRIRLIEIVGRTLPRTATIEYHRTFLQRLFKAKPRVDKYVQQVNGAWRNVATGEAPGLEALIWLSEVSQHAHNVHTGAKAA